MKRFTKSKLKGFHNYSNPQETKFTFPKSKIKVNINMICFKTKGVKVIFTEKKRKS